MIRHLDRAFIAANNAIFRLRTGKVRPEETLLLFPICLQNSSCRRPVIEEPQSCRRCGKCKVKELIEICKRTGVKISAASGGELALERARASSIRAVVAVACLKELRQGILSIFPKPVLAIPNRWPNGPCRNTDVDMNAVRTAVERFIRQD